MKKIVGNKIYLREMTTDDTEQILKWRNSEFVRERFLFREPLTRKMHETWIETKVIPGFVVQFIIGINEGGKEIGSVYFRDIDREKKTAEFGIFIGEEQNGRKGYGSEALMLALRYAANQLQMKKIFLRVLADNEKAIRIYEKNGFYVIKEEEICLPDGKNGNVLFMEKCMNENGGSDE